VSLKGGTEKTVSVKADDTVNVLLPKTEKSGIKKETEWKENISAPIEKGDILGYVNIYNGKEQIGRIPILAQNKVKKMNFGISFYRILKGLFKL